MLKYIADLQLHDSEFQTEGAPTLKVFADHARGTVSINISDNRNVRAGMPATVCLKKQTHVAFSNNSDTSGSMSTIYDTQKWH